MTQGNNPSAGSFFYQERGYVSMSQEQTYVQEVCDEINPINKACVAHDAVQYGLVPDGKSHRGRDAHGGTRRKRTPVDTGGPDQPVCRQDDQPVCGEDPESLCRQDPQPVCREDAEPLCGQDPESLRRQDPQPVCREDAESLCGQDPESLRCQD